MPCCDLTDPPTSTAARWTCAACGAVFSGSLCPNCNPAPTAGRTVCSVCGSTLDGWHCPRCDKPGMPIPPRGAPGPSDPDLPDPPPNPRPQPPTGPHHPKPEPIPVPHRAAGGSPPYYCDKCGSGPVWASGSCARPGCPGWYRDLGRALLTLVLPGVVAGFERLAADARARSDG